MTNRLPYAAKTLIRELNAAFPDTFFAYEPSDPDGYGVYHRIKFSRGHNAEIGPILEMLDDNRISEVTRTRTGIEVGFAGRRIDDRATFGIPAAQAILADAPAPAPSSTEPGEPEPPGQEDQGEQNEPEDVPEGPTETAGYETRD